MTVTEIQCRSILTRTSGYLQNVCTHSLNPYVGCGFGRSACGSGCYVQFNAWLTKGRRWGEFVDVKSNAAMVYLQTCSAEKRWANKRSLPFSIFMSSSTDPWQPAERKYRITRNILQGMLEAPPDELILQTHSLMVEEDLALIAILSRRCDLRVHISIESDVDRLPGLPPPPSSIQGRIELLEKFSQAGIKSVACMSPLLPINDPDEFFAKLTRAGASAVVVDHFIYGDGTNDGSRTHKTPLPSAMEALNPDSVSLAYRDHIVNIARDHLPTGISASGFAGKYLAPKPRKGRSSP